MSQLLEAYKAEKRRLREELRGKGQPEGWLMGATLLELRARAEMLERRKG